MLVELPPLFTPVWCNISNFIPRHEGASIRVFKHMYSSNESMQNNYANAQIQTNHSKITRDAAYEHECIIPPSPRLHFMRSLSIKYHQ